MTFAEHDYSKVKSLYRVETKLVEDFSFDYVGGPVNNPAILARIFARLGEKDREHAVVLFTDHRDMPIGYDIFSGAIDMVTIDVRQIFKVAWLINASKIAVCHNHPCGGSPEPSGQDEACAINLATSASVMGFRIIDFQVISMSGYYSFREHNHISIQMADSAQYEVVL